MDLLREESNPLEELQVARNLDLREVVAQTTNGAEDAWWLTALVLEHAKVNGKKLTGGAVDMEKCFDSINRRLAIMMLQAAGMPPGVVLAYRNFHEEVRAYNALAGGLGKPYKKVCSIPQGCPLALCGDLATVRFTLPPTSYF